MTYVTDDFSLIGALGLDCGLPPGILDSTTYPKIKQIQVRQLEMQFRPFSPFISIVTGLTKP